MILPGEKCRCVLLGKHGPEEAHDSSWWEIRSLPSFLIEESYHLKQSPYFSIWQKADSSKSFREAEPLRGLKSFPHKNFVGKRQIVPSLGDSVFRR